jgi:hypothetical protein
MLADDRNVQRHKVEVDRLLHVVCDADEYPWFVSDEATVFDVSSASEAEITARIAARCGHAVSGADLRLPLWKLAAKLSW